MTHPTFDDHNTRAIAAAQSGNLEEACRQFDLALAIDPAAADALCNYGTILNALGRYAQALPKAERACMLRPEIAQAHQCKGGAQMGLQRYDAALGSFEEAVRLDPRDALAHYHLALAAQHLGRYEDALANYRQSLELAPSFAPAHVGIGLSLAHLARHDEALASYDRALALNANDPDAHYNRANTLRDLHRHADALAAYDRALALRPEFAKARNNRAGVLKTLERFDEALADYGAALALEPVSAEVMFNRGMVSKHLGRDEEAVRDFTRALEIAPGLPYLPGALAHAKLRCHDWNGYDALVRRIVADVRLGRPVCDPLAFLALSANGQEQLACARTWAAGVRGAGHAPPAPRGGPDRRIHVAYLAADFHEHPVARLMAGVLERHDRSRFEITAASYGPSTRDDVRERIKRACERFTDVRALTDDQIVAGLRALEVDIVVDLTGHTHNARPGILARRPAALQVNYLGFPATSGASYVDYLIADAHVVPVGHELAYAERIVRLPDTFQANGNAQYGEARAATRAAAGLPSEQFVFCSFNNAYKLNPELFGCWLRILQAAPRSVLWLLRGSGAGDERLRKAAAAKDVDPGRLVFADRLPYDHYLARITIADVFLDTFPFNGGATVADALRAGLPVVTCGGDAFASRMAGSLLHAAGIAELATSSLRDYGALAVHLATHPEVLAGIRARLAANDATSALFDTARFTRHLEAAYAAMWARAVRGEAPAGFDVPAVHVL